MPRTRWNLNTREQLEHISRAEQLRALGIDIAVPKLPLPSPPAEFGIEYGYNTISNWSSSNMVLVIDARITAQRSCVLRVDDVAVALPWEGPAFDFFEMPGGRGPYQIMRGLSLNRDQVLNDRLAAGLRLQKGTTFSGSIVLVGWDAQIPAQYRHGAHVKVEITLFDSGGAELSAKGAVRIDRKLEVQPRTPDPTKKMMEGRGLFGGTPTLSLRDEMRQRAAASSKPEPKELLPGLTLRGTEEERVMQVADYLESMTREVEYKNEKR